MRDLAAGKRRIVKCEEVNHITVPYFDGLKIEKMYEFAEFEPGVMEAFPTIQRERDKLPRQYIANVIHTLVGVRFQNWVNGKAAERHDKQQKKEGMIELDADIAEIYMQSQAVSTLKGNFHNMMKQEAKRRRSKREI